MGCNFESSDEETQQLHDLAALEYIPDAAQHRFRRYSANRNKISKEQQQCIQLA